MSTLTPMPRRVYVRRLLASYGCGGGRGWVVAGSLLSCAARTLHAQASRALAILGLRSMKGAAPSDMKRLKALTS